MTNFIETNPINGSLTTNPIELDEVIDEYL